MLKILWIFLGVGMCVQQTKGAFVRVTRGDKDSVKSNIRHISDDRLTCNQNGFCNCNERSTATYIFDSASLNGKCVKDYEISNEISKGKFLPQNGKCIGATDNEKVAFVNCVEDDLSVRWIWTIHEQMLNLKTLKCLKGESKIERRGRRRRRIPDLLLEQCDSNSFKQKWRCKRNRQDVENKGRRGFPFKWITPGNDSYFQSCSEATHSYEGCYRFPDGNFMKLIDNARCDTVFNDTCGLIIQAPIASGYTSCKLDWTKSQYTISGYIWQNFREALRLEVQLSTLNSVILQIKNKSSLITKWQGNVLRLNIQCSGDRAGRSESHCAILKFQGSATDEIPIAGDPNITLCTTSNTSPASSSTTSRIKSYFTQPMTSAFPTSLNISSTGTSPPDINSQDREDKDDSSIILPIVISAVVLCCLLLAVAIVIVCKRRRRKTDSNQTEEHVYEGKKVIHQFPSTETHPVDNGPVSPIYAEIDDIRRSSKKSNGSRKVRNKSESSQEPQENPFYHTLERPDGVDDNVVYEDLDEIAKPTSPKTFEKELDL